MPYLHHVTLDTAHVYRSPRGEADDEAVAGLSDTIGRLREGRRADIEGMPGYWITGAIHGRCLIATVWRRIEGGDAPLLTFGVAADARCAPDLWRAMHDGGTGRHQTAGQPVPPTPWLAARMEIGIVHDLQAGYWIADYSRRLAWAWIEERLQ